MTPGHVFVVQGTIGEIGADAAVASTDSVFDVQPSWHKLVSPDKPFDPARHRAQRLVGPEVGTGRR